MSTAERIRRLAAQSGNELTISTEEREALEREIGHPLEYAESYLDGGLGGPGYFLFESIHLTVVEHHGV